MPKATTHRRVRALRGAAISRPTWAIVAGPQDARQRDPSLAETEASGINTPACMLTPGPNGAESSRTPSCNIVPLARDAKGRGVANGRAFPGLRTQALHQQAPTFLVDGGKTQVALRVETYPPLTTVRRTKPSPAVAAALDFLAADSDHPNYISDLRLLGLARRLTP